ncbi:preprotein translocase, SecE subunit [secondary endosymbiont of Heteropsylla cubana]|uniref:Protein translocase subunit SecE n=1 Tax=secondary endosymbiont of Heteropsylla cubana TaxID=134287 RepID=J3TGN1_9ENTR|nr:preprotein translocase subunit SecE [secondary endosymbiont of Heteropsylla cubana]AFP85632.1 preprotein translocase, SecE subunit [secondary endosymbiont of Heteropsylla cubana]
MRIQTQASKKIHRFEVVKWLIVIILLVVTIIGNHYHRNAPLFLRVLGFIFMLSIAAGMAMITAKGKSILLFGREARTEMRKVIWPTPQETLHTTFIVTTVIAAMSLILWSLDSILVRMISFITTLRF